jgi:hypothetical protein
MRGERTTKIVIEFPDEAAALNWFDDVREEGHLPADSDLFAADGLDLTHGGGAGTHVVRKTTDRAWGRLRDNLRGDAKRDRATPAPAVTDTA